MLCAGASRPAGPLLHLGGRRRLQLSFLIRPAPVDPCVHRNGGGSPVHHRSPGAHPDGFETSAATRLARERRALLLAVELTRVGRRRLATAAARLAA